MGMDPSQSKINRDKLVYMITYYYVMGEGLVYLSEQNIDYRFITRCERCFKIEFGNVQVLKDTCSEWKDYPMDDREITWIMLKAKKIPRSWD